MSSVNSIPTATTAVSASTFVESIGVNVHMSYYETSYGDVDVVASLAYLGVDHVRDNFIDWGFIQPAYQWLAADGIKIDFVIPVGVTAPNSINVAEYVSMIDAFSKAYPGSISAIEGPNEVDLWPALFNGGTSFADQGALQQSLYTAVRADSSLNGIPVYNLTMGYPNAAEYAQLGNLSSSANFANDHAYVKDSSTPAAGLASALPYASLDASGLPTVITETGYNTDPNDTYSGTDQTVQAKLTLDTLMDTFKDGVAQTYLYELLDEAPDPTNSNPQDHYGLFNSDGTPKLAATAIHNLTSILSDPGSTSSFTPGTLSYAVPNLPANGNQLLLEKSNGTFDLVLWAESQIWDPNTQSEVVAPSETTTVNFGQVQKLVSIFDPLQGTSPIATYSNVQSIQLTLTDHPLIIEISGGTTTLATPTLTAATPTLTAFSPDSGTVGDGVTNATVLTLAGTAVANSTVTVFDGGQQLGTATANASGAWSFTTATLAANATHSFTATATDAAGNTSAVSAAMNVTVDTLAPSAPAITSFSPDSGTVGDGITNATVLTLTGTAAAGSTVAVFDSGKQIGTATANTSGAWSFTTGTLASAGHTFTATATDAAGNTSTVSAALAVTVDTVAPSAPVIATDVVINTNEVMLTGTAEANSLVTVFDGTTQLGTATANASGAWSYTTGHLSSGAHAFTATATDAAGNTSLASHAVDPTIGAAPPAAPTITSFSPDSGHVGDGITNATVLTLAGTAIANSTVAVFDSGKQIGTATANASGAWSFTTATLAANATHSFTATATDAAGNTSAVSAALAVTVDTLAPSAPAITSFSPDSGHVGDGITNATVLTLTGTAAAGSTVVLFDGGKQVGTATANAGGAWNFTTATLAANATHSFTATATDAAGNTSAASAALTVTVDTLAPSAPIITSDAVVNTNEVMLIGTAEANSLINVFDGTTELGTVTTNGSGAWSYTTGHLSTGAHAFAATAVDAAGNTSMASQPADPTIGAPAPTVPKISSFSPDTGKVGDGITDASVLKLTGSADAGSVVKIFDGSTLLGSTTANSSGAWNFTTTKLADGSHIFTATDTNAAGSTSAASAALNVTVDTHAPTPTFTNLVHNSNGSVTLSGTSEASSVLSIYDGNSHTPLGTLTTNANGTWSFTTAKLSNGVHSFSLTATDAAGNVGSGSNVALYGTTGNNTIKVGPGNDLVTGNGGADTFVFGSNLGKDVITDFQVNGGSHDVLQFSHNTFSSFASVLAHAAQVGSDVVITADAADSVTLKNVHLSSLQKSDIHIV